MSSEIAFRTLAERAERIERTLLVYAIECLIAGWRWL